MARTRRTSIPGADRRIELQELREKGVAALFGRSPGATPPLVVEIGFGRGEFLLHLAAQSPEALHLGVELSAKRVLKVARRCAGAGYENLRLLRASGEALLADALEDGSVQCFWVNFPDPWPKKRHHKKRLLQAPIVHQLAKRLAPLGRLEVATDHADYARQIVSVLRDETLLENLLAPAPFAREVAGRAQTAYEQQWRAEGRPLHFFRYRRRP